MECVNDVCGMRRVGGHRIKRSEWWNEVGGVASNAEEDLRNGYREEIEINKINK